MVRIGNVDYDVIAWWEGLSGEERDKYLAGKLWEGTIEERHKLLLSFYRRRKRIQVQCPAYGRCEREQCRHKKPHEKLSYCRQRCRPYDGIDVRDCEPSTPQNPKEAR